MIKLTLNPFILFFKKENKLVKKKFVGKVTAQFYKSLNEAFLLKNINSLLCFVLDPNSFWLQVTLLKVFMVFENT